MKINLGFEAPVKDAQVCFKQVLNALSQPGKVFSLPDDVNSDWQGLNGASRAILLSLCDQDTLIYMAPAFNNSVLHDSIAFHTQAKITKNLKHAQFAFFDHSVDLATLKQLNIGEDISPETATFVIIQLTDLPRLISEDEISSDNDNTIAHPPLLRLTGPGILDNRVLQTTISIDILTYLTRNSIAFPKGIDCIFTYQNHMLGITRTTQVEVITCM